MKMLIGMIAGALLAAGFNDNSLPSRAASLGPTWEPVAYLIVFTVFAYVWYAAWLTWARMGRKNIHYVDRETLARWVD